MDGGIGPLVSVGRKAIFQVFKKSKNKIREKDKVEDKLRIRRQLTTYDT